MNAAFGLNLLGATVGMCLFTRLTRMLFSRIGYQDPALAVASVSTMVVIAVVVGAFGFADGGPLQWERPLWLYVPSGALVLAIDLLAWRGRRPVENPDRLKGIRLLANSPVARTRHRAVLLDFVAACNTNDFIRTCPLQVRNAYAVASSALSADEPAQEWDAVGLLGAIHSVHWSEVAGTSVEPILERAVRVSLDTFKEAQDTNASLVKSGNGRQRQHWTQWEQGSVGIGALGVIAAFLNPKITDASLDLGERVAFSIGGVVGAMVFGALLGALFSLVSAVFRRRADGARLATSSAAVDIPGWRRWASSWGLWIGLLLLGGALAPLPFQRSAEGKTADVLRVLRFSPMTGLGLKEVPGLDAEVERIFSSLFDGAISEDQAMGRLRVLLKDARVNHLNLGFRNSPDTDALLVGERGLAVVRHLQRIDPALCRQFGVSETVDPDRLDAPGRVVVTRYQDALRAAYTNGLDADITAPIATAEEASLLFQRLGITQENLQRAAVSDVESCAFSVRSMEAFTTLPDAERAKLQRYVLNQEPP